MLNQVADGVWVRQSAWVWSNAIAVRGERYKPAEFYRNGRDQ